MSGELRRLLRRAIDRASRRRADDSASAYLSLERCYPLLAPADPGAASAPADHGLVKTYKKGCKCDWCRNAARLAKQRTRERARAVA